MLLHLWSACLVNRKPWIPSPIAYKWSMVVPSCNPSTWEVESGHKIILDYIMNLKPSLSYMRLCLKCTETF